MTSMYDMTTQGFIDLAINKAGDTTLDADAAYVAICHLRRELQGQIGLKNPELARDRFFVCASHNEAIERLGDDRTDNHTSHWLGLACAVDWIAAYTAMAQKLRSDGREYEDKGRVLQTCVDLCNAGVWDTLCYENAVAVIRRPKYIRLEATPGDPTWMRLHCADGPAILMDDPTGKKCAQYWIHGVRVERRVVMEPEKLQVADVVSQRNQEVRRVILARMGEERFLREANATLVSEDEYGALYEVQVGEEPERYIRLVDKSPQIDGSFRIYFSRVAPTVRTPREAIASRYGLSAEAYAPTLET